MHPSMGNSGLKTKENLQLSSILNTTEDYSHTQPSSGWPELHQGPACTDCHWDWEGKRREHSSLSDIDSEIQ